MNPFNELEHTNRINFLYGQLELYKIEFSNTGNNKYLEVMNELNKTINHLREVKRLIDVLYIDNVKFKRGMK